MALIGALGSSACGRRAAVPRQGRRVDRVAFGTTGPRDQGRGPGVRAGEMLTRWSRRSSSRTRASLPPQGRDRGHPRHREPATRCSSQLRRARVADAPTRDRKTGGRRDRAGAGRGRYRRFRAGRSRGSRLSLAPLPGRAEAARGDRTAARPAEPTVLGPDRSDAARRASSARTSVKSAMPRKTIFAGRGTHDWPPELVVPDVWSEPYARAAEEIDDGAPADSRGSGREGSGSSSRGSRQLESGSRHESRSQHN